MILGSLPTSIVKDFFSLLLMFSYSGIGIKLWNLLTLERVPSITEHSEDLLVRIDCFKSSDSSLQKVLIKFEMLSMSQNSWGKGKGDFLQWKEFSLGIGKKNWIYFSEKYFSSWLTYFSSKSWIWIF